MAVYSVQHGRGKVTQRLKRVEEAALKLRHEYSDEGVNGLLDALCDALNQGEKLIMAAEMREEPLGCLAVEDRDDTYRIRKLQREDGTFVCAAFTCMEEALAGEETEVIVEDVENCLSRVLMDPQMEGIILNPWNKACYLAKDQVRTVFERCLPQQRVKRSIRIVPADIAKIDISCIVNEGSPSLPCDSGVSEAISLAAGSQLREACRKLCSWQTGHAKITQGFGLKAKYVIHTVSPMYSGAARDWALLRQCYWHAMELAQENGIHDIAFPPISTGTTHYPLKEACAVAVNTVNDWLKIHSQYGMRVVFACHDDEIAGMYRVTLKQVRRSQEDFSTMRGSEEVVERAMRFAMAYHKGVMRKGTTKPYILHPIATLQILCDMHADFNLMAAGILHDTLEDTSATLLEVYEQFGVDIASLVIDHTEDKRRTWYMRKLHAIRALPKSSIRQMMLVMADRVANMRDMLGDYQQMGDALWTRFNAPKELQAWYARNMIEGLSEMRELSETEDVYREMGALYRELFVTCKVDEQAGVLYQVSADGEKRALRKGAPKWRSMKGSMPAQTRTITGREADALEKQWSESFWAVLRQDLRDAAFLLFDHADRSLQLQIEEGRIKLAGRHLRGANGDESGALEGWYHLDQDSTRRFLTKLRMKYGLQAGLGSILKTQLGHNDGDKRFKMLCDEFGVDPGFSSY